MIVIPSSVWDELFDRFRARPNAEQVAYLDGVRIAVDHDEPTGVVTTFVLPDAKVTPGNFHVSAEAMSQAGQHFRSHGLARLAQVHTHPTEWIDHSGWDDDHAYSQRDGSLSLVLPNYGRVPVEPHDAGVHVRTRDGWVRLSSDVVKATIRIVPSVLDYRSETWHLPTDTNATSDRDGTPRPRPPRRWSRWWLKLIRRR